MPRFFVIDTGGTARLVRRLFVVDTGGTSRLIRRAFVIDSGGTARQFYSGEPTIFLNSTYDFEHSTFSPFSASASFQLTNVGEIRTIGASNTVVGMWIDDVSLAGNYEVLATLVSGTLSSGTTGTYQALSTSRSWNVSRSPSGAKACTFTLQIRKIGTGTVLDSTTVTLTASVDA